MVKFDDEYEENPKSDEQRRKEYQDRLKGEAEARQRADPKVGLCYVGARTKVKNLDGIEIEVVNAVTNRLVPKEFAVGYKVYIKSIRGDKAVITSTRKLANGEEWALSVNLSNLECFYGLGKVEGDGHEGLEALFGPDPEDPKPKPRRKKAEAPAGDFKEVFGDIGPAPAPAPIVAKKVAILLISMFGSPVGARVPVLSETPNAYEIKDPAWQMPLEVPKMMEGTHYRIEADAEIPLPPAPAGPVAPPAPMGMDAFTKAWQFVETEEAKNRRKILKDPKIKELVAKLPKIYNVLGDHFQWNKDFDRDVFASIFLIPNSSLVLKGVPGTGKTQLIEMATLMFANDCEVPGLDLRVFDEIGREAGSAMKHRRFLTQWLLDRGVLGSVKHNADKQIQDVFFFTKINIEKFNMKGSPVPAKAMVEEAPKPIEMPILEKIEEEIKGPVMIDPAPIPTPAKDQEKAINLLDMPENDEDIFGVRQNPLPIKWKGTFPDKPDSLDIYDISPEPRPIVYSLIKFHNEANRMNANVADVLLGLMSEQEVEYQGKKFVSPVKWNETKGLLFDEGADRGSISFFDYNPHLEVDNPNMELDRALLDRITAGFYLSGGNTGMRFSIMDKKSKGIKQPREVVFEMLKRGDIHPVTRKELTGKDGLWELVNGSRGGSEPSVIPIDAEVMAWIAWMTNLPNLTNKMYGGAYQGDISPGIPISGRPIDRTLSTFYQALETLDDLKPVSGGIAVEGGDPYEGIQVAIAELKRPLGVRSAEAMVSLLRAVMFLKKSTLRGQTPDDYVIYCKTDRDRDEVFNILCELLPYILDHRINLGVGPALKAEFLSTFDLIKYYFVPAMKAQKGVLFSVMDGLMAVYVENMKRMNGNKTKLTEREKAEMFQRVLAAKLSERAPGVNFESLVTPGPSFSSHVMTLVDLLGAM
jgi:hypothetical protein